MSSEITSASPISDIITPLRTAVHPTLFEWTLRELSYREAMFKREKEELVRKINNLEKDGAVADKEYKNLNREYGELLLRNGELDHSNAGLETQHHLTRMECEALRCELHDATNAAARLKEENAKMTAKSEEVLRKEGEIRDLKEMCASLEKGVEAFMEENSKLSEKNAELMKLQSQYRAYGDIVGKLRAKKAAIQEENKEMKVKSEAAAASEAVAKAELREAGRREQKLAADVVRREKQIKDMEVKNKNLERDYIAVRSAATERYRSFEKRVEDLEANVALLQRAIDTDEQRVNNDGQEPLESFGSDEGNVETQSDCRTIVIVEENSGSSVPSVKEEQWSIGSDANSEGLLRNHPACEETPLAEKMASPKPFVKEELRSIGSDANSEGLVRNHPVCEGTPLAEKTASPKPFPPKSSSIPIPIPIYISDSDDESEGLQRKLLVPDAAYEKGIAASGSKRKWMEAAPLTPEPKISHNSAPTVSTNHLKKSFTALKPCDWKVGGASDSHNGVEVESGNSIKLWEFEADMIADLDKHVEISMKAICALYRKQISLCGSSAASICKYGVFSPVDAYRGLRLGRYLVAENPEGGLKRSLAELEKHDPTGTDTCRKIALNHAGQLFKIYQSREDPHFAPPN